MKAPPLNVAFPGRYEKLQPCTELCEHSMNLQGYLVYFSEVLSCSETVPFNGNNEFWGRSLKKKKQRNQ